MPLGTIFDPATTRPVVAGQVDPITGRVATGNGFVRDPFPGNIIPAGRLDPNAARPDAPVSRRRTRPGSSTTSWSTGSTPRTSTPSTCASTTTSATTTTSSRATASPTTHAQAGAVRGRRRRRRLRRGRRDGAHPRPGRQLHEDVLAVAHQRGALRLQPRVHQPAPAATATTRATFPASSASRASRSSRATAACRAQHRRPPAARAAGWLVSERLSNTLQLTDNLTKIYKSHTFKTGFMLQNIFFRWTEPPCRRGRFRFDGFYTSIPNRQDISTGRAQFLLHPIASTVPGGVDFVGGLNQVERLALRRDRTRSRPTSARTCRTAGASARSSPSTTACAGTTSAARETRTGAGQLRARAAGARTSFRPSGANIPLSQLPSATCCQGRHQPRLHRRVRQRDRQDAEEQLRAAPRLRLAALREAGACAAGTGSSTAPSRTGAAIRASATTTRSSSRWPTSRRTTSRRTGYPDGSLVGLDAREPASRSTRSIVNANGLTLRGVEFDYKTPLPQLQPDRQNELPGHHSVEVGYVGSRASNVETFVGSNDVTQLLPPGTTPACT